MNLNYAIFRGAPIYTINDLVQIGTNNKIEKQTYKSNPDIKLNLSKYNVELVPLAEKYVKVFYNITKDYRKENDERKKTEHEDRKKKMLLTFQYIQQLLINYLIMWIKLSIVKCLIIMNWTMVMNIIKIKTMI